MEKTLSSCKKKLKQKETELYILRNISELINYHGDLNKILDALVRIISEYAQSNSCFLYLVENREAVLQASQNPKKHRKDIGTIRMKIGEGITGWVAKHQKTVEIPLKAYDDERFKFFNSLPEDKYEAFLSVPMLSKGKTIGVINLQHIKQKKYKAEQIAFLEIIAQQIAGIIENARLLAETNILKETLETRKSVEKAKGILMKQYQLTEADAHQLLNKKSMDTRKTLKEVAEAIILSEEILKK